MKKISPSSRASFKLAKHWSIIAIVAAGVLLGTPFLAKAAAPAGTEIGNQATATYLDPDGTLQLATSNPVNTLVQQVGALTLDSSGTKIKSAGDTAQIPHTLTNIGNGVDRFTLTVTENNGATAPDFTRVEIFLDADGNGEADNTTALCTSTVGAGSCVTAPLSVPGNGGVFKFVVAYTIPSTATSVTWPGNLATVTAAAVPSAVPYAVSSVSNVDTVNLTEQAAFSVTQSMLPPAVAAGTAVAWPTPLSSGPRGSRTVLTFKYTNSGLSPGTLFLSDVIPAGFTYVANSAVWSNAPGIFLNDAQVAETVAGIEFEVSGQTMRARIDNVGRNVSGSINSNSGTTIGAGTTLQFNRSNAYSSTKIIGGQGSVIQAGTGTSTLGAANAYTGTTTVSGGTLKLGVNSALPAVSATSVSSGSTLDLDGKTQTLSAGLTDSGTLALRTGGVLTLSGSSSTIAGANVTGSGKIIVQTGATLTLTSALANSGVEIELAGGTLYLGTFIHSIGTLTVSANSTLDFASAGTAQLTAGIPAITVTLTDCAATTHAGTTTDGNGAWSLNIPGNVSAGTAVCLNAALPASHLATGASAAGTAVPDGSPATVGSTTYTYTRASHRLSFAAPASGTATANFGSVARSTFTAASARQGVPGTSAEYPHVFTAGTTGVLTVSVAQESPTPAMSGWTGLVFADPGCTGKYQTSATRIYPPGEAINVVQGQVYCMILRELVPAVAANTHKTETTLQALLTFSNASPSLSASYTLVDTTTASKSPLELQKDVRNITTNGAFSASNQAKSGELLEYRITYLNKTAAPLTQISLHDAIPAYTTFQSATAAAPPAGLGNCIKNTPQNASPAPAVNCAAAQATGGAGEIRWTFDGPLNPSMTGEVSFRVVVD